MAACDKETKGAPNPYATEPPRITETAEPSLTDAPTATPTDVPTSTPTPNPTATPTPEVDWYQAMLNNGVLIKSGGAVEALAQVDVVCVDKTGTLTSAQLKIDEVVTFDYCKNCLKKIVASIERNSSHPIAKALSKDVTEYKEVTTI